jgi:peroxiredoxin
MKILGLLQILLTGLCLPWMARGEDAAIVDLTGRYTAVVTVRNSDGSPAVGVRYRLTYHTPSERETVLYRGTPEEQKFRFESANLIVFFAAGITDNDGVIRLNRLAGAPRTFSLLVGDDGTLPGDFPAGSGFLQISFTNRVTRTNHYTLDLPKTVALGERAPDFLAKDVFTNKMRSLADFEGKLIVLKFWSTRCGPCQPQMEKHNQLITRKKDWAGRVVFLAVGMDDDEKVLRSHIEEKGWTQFQHLWAANTNGAFGSKIARSYGIGAVPACYVVHPSGVVIWRGDTEEMDKIIDHFLSLKESKDVQAWFKQIEDVRASR